MRDPDIRAAFHENVLKSAHADENTIVVNEFGLHNGQVRADIAVFNGKMEAFEIKGELDNLDRLLHQIQAYNSVFQRINLITSDRHFTRCVATIPDWWGLYFILPTDKGSLTFQKIRGASHNPLVDAYSVAQLLWKKEGLEIASQYTGKVLSKNTTRDDIHQYLASNLSKTTLQKVVLSTIKQRKNLPKGRLPL